jgi:hypothetical protein
MKKMKKWISPFLIILGFVWISSTVQGEELPPGDSPAQDSSTKGGES